MEKFSVTGFEGQLVANMNDVEGRAKAQTPFRVILLGDWSGRANRRQLSSPAELKTCRPLLVDRDNLDQMIARLGVRLRVPITADGSQSLAISFMQLDDFHPDRLFQRLDIFESLRRLRAGLENPKTFAEAAAAVQKWEELSGREPEPAEPKTVPGEIESKSELGISGGSVLDQILESGGRTQPAKLSQPAEQLSAEISKLAEAVAKPYLTPDIQADQEQMIAAVDARIAGNLKAIMHHQDFQALEGAWRGLDFLVSRLHTGTDLKLYLLDLSFDEFKSDLQAAEDLRATALYKLLVEETVGTAGGIPWAVIAGNYTFNLATADRQLLELISAIAQEAGAPFVAGATSHLLGCDSLAETPDPHDWGPLSSDVEESWKHVTTLQSAPYVGLGLPRFLGRLPYGKQTNPTEEFEFEELTVGDSSVKQHELYVWANAGFAVVYLLARGFAEEGWQFRPSDYLEIENLPLHIYEQDGESQIKPCAEVLLTIRAAGMIIDRGLMPLLSMKDSDLIRLGMCQSIAGTSLPGRWDAKAG